MQEKIIWTNGCFDILHIGHIQLFKFAKNLGTKLIVGIDSDQRVKTLKGKERPINTEKDRMCFLESIKYIDEVVIFNSENSLIENIKNKNIDIIVVGSDYINKKVVGSEFVKEVIFYDRIEQFSTTNIIRLMEKI